MTTKTNIFMKRVMPVAMALLMVLSVVLVPVHADAAEPSAVTQLILAKGQTWELVIHGLEDDAKVTYKTSKKSVATVSKKGKIKAKKKGKANITVTVKQGGETYKGKVKVTVKAKTTAYNQICNAAYDFVEYYNICANYANANGWNNDKDVVEWFEAYEEAVSIVQEMLEDKDAYEAEEVLELMLGITETVLEMLPILAEPYEG